MAAPGTVWAGVCDTLRPGWTPGTAPGLLDETLALATTLPSLVLLAATLACAVYRLQWGSLVVVLLWTGWVSALLFLPVSDLQAQAIAEGCIGSPSLFVGLATLLCMGLILYTAPRTEPG